MPLLAELGVKTDETLTVEGMVTNKFIDTSIGVAG